MGAEVLVNKHNLKKGDIYRDKDGVEWEVIGEKPDLVVEDIYYSPLNMVWMRRKK